MNDKQQILTVLREEFRQWEELLADKGEERIAIPRAPLKPYNRSLKDVVAHLAAWQQVSLARADAAYLDRSPEFPAWLAGRDPDVDDAAELDRLNDSIYEATRDQPWARVQSEWRRVFLRFLELAERFPESDLGDAGRYPWLAGHPLSLVFLNSCEHHQEHRMLLASENILEE